MFNVIAETPYKRIQLCFDSRLKNMDGVIYEIGEKIKIGDAVTITLIGFTGGNLTIGIDAPIDIPVHREEVLALIKSSNSNLSQYQD